MDYGQSFRIRYLDNALGYIIAYKKSRPPREAG